MSSKTKVIKSIKNDMIGLLFSTYKNQISTRHKYTKFVAKYHFFFKNAAISMYDFYDDYDCINSLYNENLRSQFQFYIPYMEDIVVCLKQECF